MSTPPPLRTQPAPRWIARDLAGALPAAILFVVMATVGAKWLPVFAAGGLLIELSNFGTLMIIGLGALLIIARGQIRISAPLVILLVLQIVLFYALFSRGQPPGIIVMSSAGTLGMLALAQVDHVNRPGIFFWAFVSFLSFLGLSILVSGVDLIGGIQEFLASGNRERFFHQVLRPIYNAFSSSGDEERTTVLNNSVAATFALFFIISGIYVLCGRRYMIPLAGIALLGSVLLYSSSAMLAALLSCMVMGIVWLRHARGPWKIYFSFSGAIVGCMTIAPKLIEGLSSSLNEDSHTRGERLKQYVESLNVVDKEFWLGAGIVQVDGYLIHNFFLFSFAAAGIIGAILSGAVIVSAVWISIRGLWCALKEPVLRPEPLLCACLPFLFLVRVMFGGGGGMPAGTGILSFGLALVAARALPPLHLQKIVPRPAAVLPMLHEEVKRPQSVSP